MLISCRPADETITAQLTAQMSQNAQQHGLVAQSLVVNHNAERLFEHVDGTFDFETDKAIKQDSVFPIFSLSKLFASTLVMMLVEQGQLDVTDPISKYLPNLPEHWSGIRLTDCLNHASGLPEYYQITDGQLVAPGTQHQALTQLATRPLAFEPGTETRYNQTNYLVVKAILEEITGLPYRTLVTQRVLQPLKLSRTYLGVGQLPEQDKITAYLANSGEDYTVNRVAFPDYAISHADAYSTAADFSRFLSALASGQLVSAETLRKHWQPYVLANGEASYFAGGWEYETTGNWIAVGHDGGALVRARLLFNASFDEYYLILYLTSGNTTGVWSRSLVESVQYYVLPDWYSKLSTLL